MSMATEGFSTDPTIGTPDIVQPTGETLHPGPTGKSVTMATIARAAGVSQGAISSLLNDRDYGIRVSPKTRDRVFKVCREMGYIPNDLRAVVRMYPELGETCLLVSNRIPDGLANPFVSRVAAALMSKGSGQHCSVTVAAYDEAVDYGTGEELPSPLKNGIASRILVIGNVNPSISAIVRRRTHPLIVLGHAARLPGSTSIVPEYVSAARLALGLLVRHGHKRLGIVGGQFGTPEPRISEMNRAIGSVAAEMGFHVEGQDVFHGNLTFDSGVEGLYSMIGRSTSPTAILCLSEAAATGVLAGAYARGISVPADLSVIAVVDHEGALPSCPPLTAVVISADEMAAMAMQQADLQLQVGIPLDAQTIGLGVKLIERMTCGPAKT
jgi:LacI family transcriptional regulator